MQSAERRAPSTTRAGCSVLYLQRHCLALRLGRTPRCNPSDGRGRGPSVDRPVQQYSSRPCLREQATQRYVGMPAGGCAVTVPCKIERV
jgi:hypothetical protein